MVAHLAGEGGMELAERFIHAVDSSLARLQETPEIGRCRAESTRARVRSWPVRGFMRVLIFYRVGDETIEVVRVVRGERDLEALFERER